MARDVIGSRRQARDAALRILYLWEVGRTEPSQAVGVFFREHAPDASSAVVEFATALVLGTVAEVNDLDALIERHAQHWRLERFAVIDRLILRMAAWELRHRGETPAPAILNEAVELARRFSSNDAARFVNGVLDAVWKTISASDEVGGVESR